MVYFGRHQVARNLKVWNIQSLKKYFQNVCCMDNKSLCATLLGHLWRLKDQDGFRYVRPKSDSENNVAPVYLQTVAQNAVQWV